MNIDERLKSLTDIMDDGIADCYVVDSCATGSSFLTHNPIAFDRYRSRHNDLDVSRVRDGLRNAEAFVEFLRQYPSVGTVPMVMDEHKIRESILSEFVRSFGRRNYHKGLGREARHPASINKCSKVLSKLNELEIEAGNILRGRLYTSEDKDSLREYEELVIDACEIIRQRNGSINDEIIVASAMHYAHKNEKHVALITGDARFEGIVRKTQGYLNSLNSTIRNESLREFLLNGGLSIIYKDENSFFDVAYCSEEFARIRHPTRQVV